jgi:hypothetical protein
MVVKRNLIIKIRYRYVRKVFLLNALFLRHILLTIVITRNEVEVKEEAKPLNIESLQNTAQL